MGRFACPTGSTLSIIEETPPPAASTGKPEPWVRQYSYYPPRGRVLPGSTITEERPQPAASTSKAVPIKAKRVNFSAADKGKGKGPLTSAQRTSKKEDIIEARKKEQLRHKVALDRKPTSFVFVGNLDLKITEADIRKAFKNCGPITRVIFRCSQGRPHPTQEPVSLRDRKYATVEFKNLLSVRAALQRNGGNISDQETPMIVCASAADLPEVKEIANYFMKKMKNESQSKPARWLNNMRALVRQPTDVFVDFTQAANDKFRAQAVGLDFSFAKTIS